MRKKQFIKIILILLLTSCKKDESEDKPTCYKADAPEVSAGMIETYGHDLQLYAGTVSGASSYEWIGPNNFTSLEQNPVIYHMTQLNAGRYKVRVKVIGGCYSEYSEFPVYLAISPPSCSPASNNVTIPGLTVSTFTTSPSQFAIGASGKFEINCSNSSSNIHFYFTTASKPISGVYRLTTLTSNSQDDQAEMTFTIGGATYKTYGNGTLTLWNNSNTVGITFCNITFKNTSTGDAITGCMGNITEP